MSAAEVIAKAMHDAYEYDANGADSKDILDALKAAGYAVVELPKPNCCAEDLQIARAAWIDLAGGTECVAVVDDEVNLKADAGYYSPAEARSLASALLAAADVAEVIR